MGAIAGWVTVAEAARVIQPETEDDKAAMIACLEAASGLVLDFIQIDLLQRLATERYDGTGSDRMLLRRAPINSVLSVVVGVHGAPTDTAARMAIEPARILHDDKFAILTGACFTEGRLNIDVTYDAGYVVAPRDGYRVMPAPVRFAVIYTAKAMVSAAAFDFNTAGESAAGAYSAQYLPASLGGIPPAAQALLSSYVRTAAW